MADAIVDALVVGGGPAGLSAALWLARYRRQVVVVDSGDYRNARVEQTHGYFGYGDCDPAELRARALDDLAAYPRTAVRRTTVEAVRRSGSAFTAQLGDGDELRALRVVLATGVRDRFPEVDGFLDHYGASAFHCPTCDGYEARDRTVVVLGWSADLAGFALGLLDWARHVTLVTDGRSFEGDAEHRDVLARHGIDVVEASAAALDGTRGDLRAVRLGTGRSLPCDLLFFSLAHEPRAGLAVALGCALTAEGCVVVDDAQQTTVPGVYAAGDLTPGIQLVQVATAKGTIAGVQCAQSLRGEPGAPRSPEPAPDYDAELGSVRVDPR
ncbi:MAG: NAD(P)/FAD-dependent oxidoreductase [Mycobacteriales bacterium]|nr:NAD(P)/FAD-dependent oxidoreductase [Actinomycetota bacterium]